MTWRGRIPREVLHAAKVALVASLLIGVVFGACVIVLDLVVGGRAVQSVDSNLADRLFDIRTNGHSDAPTTADDSDSAPIYLWYGSPHGPVRYPGSNAPRLPAHVRLTAGAETTITLRSARYRLVAQAIGDRTVIAGQSLASEDHLISLLRTGEALAAPFLVIAMFAGALIIGLRALSPVEQARRRQLEFTADASHELRTPLSVITAETSVALSSPRDADDYRATLGRIDRESGRLRKIVDDLLWLARFDSAPPLPVAEPLDLATIAADCADRFRPVGATADFQVQLRTEDQQPVLISAPPDWIDRLAGVLMDNACRFAGPGGTIRISAAQRGSRVMLTVEDSGPGVPAEMRSHIFDRFHRSTEQGGSAGLGLAIADS
ncbi:MAG: HAMP domain-containing histidine kinase, partial [Actinobacteria bacterium]|nr:HAMP domain-containing histidine kinase [Actinomycetota bacterium]